MDLEQVVTAFISLESSKAFDGVKDSRGYYRYIESGCSSVGTDAISLLNPISIQCFPQDETCSGGTPEHPDKHSV